MLKNYLKTAFRSLLKNKGFSVLNIFGLAIGITCASLIFLWVEDELNYDKSFPNRDTVYKVLTNQDYNGDIYTFDATPGQLAPTLKSDIPGIAYATHFNGENHLFAINDKVLYKYGAYVDDDFYTMFSLQFVEGNLKNVASDINGIVITQKTAQQFFNTDKNVVGKTVKIDNDKYYKITGVITDLPENVSLKYSWLASFKAYQKDKEYLKFWSNNSTSTIVQLDKNANFDLVSKEVKKMIPAHTDNNGRTYGILHAMKNWRLRDHFEDGVQIGGRIDNVRLFFIIACIILIIACINFMNLSTARSSQRANEIGVRKVLGSKRSHLIVQFFLEAFTITILATVISMLLLMLLLPQFNQLVNKQLSLGLTQPTHLMSLFSIILFCSLLAGFYPALYLSSFQPVKIFKGLKHKKGGANFIRNGLVVSQFAVSISLIIATIIIYSQINYVKNRDVGYNKSNLIAINVRGDILKNYDAVKQEMLNTGLIENIGLNSYNVMHGGYNGSGFGWEGKPEKFDPLISFRFIDSGFIPTAEMTIIDGHNFYGKPNKEKTEVIITSSLANMMGSGSAVGKLIRRGDEAYEVIGVVNDFLFGSMYSQKKEPVIFFNNADNAEYIYARIKENTPLDKAVASLSTIMKKNNPAFPVQYSFVEDTFNAKFRNEKLVEKLSQWFAVLTVIISCLGLFGLAAYMTEQRTKEIGVRKVLGASVSSIVNLLSKDFLKLVFTAIIIATPLTWWEMSKWLQGYAYHIDIHWWMFALAGLSAVLIAILTVSYQSIKAAITNPAKSLRTE